MYWNHLKNDGLHNLYNDWLEQNPPYLPKKYLPKPIRGEPENEERLRFNNAINEMKTNREILASRATRFKTKTEIADNEMEEFIRSKCSSTILQDLVIEIWKEDCSKEESKSRTIWEEKCKWHEEKRTESLNKITERTDTRKSLNTARQFSNSNRQKSRTYSPKRFESRPYPNMPPLRRPSFRPSRQGHRQQSGQFQGRQQCPFNRSYSNQRRQSSPRYIKNSWNPQARFQNNQPRRRTFTHNQRGRNTNRTFSVNQPRGRSKNRSFPNIQRFTPNNYPTPRSRSRSRTRSRTRNNNYSRWYSNNQSSKNRIRSRSNERRVRFTNRQSFLAGAGRNISFRDNSHLSTSRGDQEQMNLDRAIAMSIAQEDMEEEELIQRENMTTREEDNSRTAATLDDSTTPVKDLMSPTNRI